MLPNGPARDNHLLRIVGSAELRLTLAITTIGAAQVGVRPDIATPHAEHREIMHHVVQEGNMDCTARLLER